MGLFSKLFKKDPAEELSRARKALERDDAVTALRIADKLSSHDEVGGEAAALAQTARDSLLQGALDKAAVAEEAGLIEEAADRLELAMEYADEAGRAELEERVRRMLLSAEKAKEQHWLVKAHEDLPDNADDPETIYRSLVGMFDEEVAEHYKTRPEEFRLAFVDLNEGRAERALPVFDGLLERDPEDPVLRFERGRARLLTDDLSGARADFEAVWEVFGDEPLDLAGQISVPAAWADAGLGMEDFDGIVERLEEQADPGEESPGLSYRYATALVRSERLDRASEFLGRCTAAFSSDIDFPHLWAKVLERSGDGDRAVDILETAIAPSCDVGRCGVPSLDAPALRTLARMHLDRGDNPERARELLALVARSKRGSLEAVDQVLLGRHYHQADNTEARDEALAVAAELVRLSSPNAAALEGQLQRLRVEAGYKNGDPAVAGLEARLTALAAELEEPVAAPETPEPEVAGTGEAEPAEEIAESTEPAAAI